MCMTCFLQYTDEPVVNDLVLKCVDAIKQCDDPDFGPLHIIVSDMNIEDSNIKWVRKNAHPDEKDRVVLDLLDQMSEEERASALAIEWGYFDREGNPV